ncbi:MAG: glycosyltransferase family 4 protein [Deltaproteobacteria bacterium]|nr:glycosyltransferase family 4 protein [Deltaproteobacteria bacterium]
MRILAANKFYFHKGGDTTIFFATIDLLKSHGHDVSVFAMDNPKNLDSDYKKYFVSNVDLNEGGGLKGQVKSAARILYSFEARKKISGLIDAHKPEVAHLHNIYHQVSPSIIDALKAKGVPVVMTLHDYKLTCPAYSLMNKGGLCEACTGGRYYNVFKNKCTKGSAVKSLVNMAEMYLHHKIMKVYGKVDVFISPSRFLLEKTKEMGFKGEVVLLPNLVDISEYEPMYQFKDRTIAYLGRLSAEKGTMTLLDGVKGLDIRLRLIGDGPMREALEKKCAAEGISNVEFLGFRRGQELQDDLKSAMFTVITSECYENNPRSVIESFALGKPVVGARIGGIPELVRDGVTGFTFNPGDSKDLMEKIKKFASNPKLIENYGKNARKIAEKEYNPETHYTGLMKIYESAIRKSRQRN